MYGAELTNAPGYPRKRVRTAVARAISGNALSSRGAWRESFWQSLEDHWSRTSSSLRTSSTVGPNGCSSRRTQSKDWK
eukprot:13477388-Heterocapsa_arctica.AAC.1